MNVEELKTKAEDLREKIKGAEHRKATAEGKLEALMAQLKKEFGVDSIEAAEKKLTKLDEERKKLEDERTEVEQEISELLEKHDVGVSEDSE